MSQKQFEVGKSPVSWENNGDEPLQTQMSRLQSQYGGTQRISLDEEALLLPKLTTDNGRLEVENLDALIKFAKQLEMPQLFAETNELCIRHPNCKLSYFHGAEYLCELCLLERQDIRPEPLSTHSQKIVNNFTHGFELLNGNVEALE